VNRLARLPPVTRCALPVAVLLVMAAPTIVSDLWLTLLTRSMILGLATLSVVVLHRATGTVSLCQASLMGVAANSTTWLAVERGWPLSVALVLGSCSAVPIGTILVIPALRLRGIELMIITLAVAPLVASLVFAADAPFRASSLGIHLQSNSVVGFDLSRPHESYYVVLASVALITAATVVLLQSRVGKTWRAMRTGNAVAGACGIPVVRYKLLGFAVSSLLAGLSGSLLLAVQRAADPSEFSLFVSIRLLVVATIGGIDSVFSMIPGGLASGVGPRVPAEFGLGVDWFGVVVGFGVVVAVLHRGQRSTVAQAG
jgi:branched-chain amino acid transport system permease protein